MKSLLRSIKYSLNFPLRVIKTRRNLYPIDKKSPFKGPLSENGVYHQKISDKCIEELKNFYSDSGKKPNSIIHLRKHQASIVKEVFETINPIVRDYLGNESFLDGINWMYTSPKEVSISGNWHTDNVGNRLKCFICFEGDGSMPTLIIPSKYRLPRKVDLIKNSFIELLRWMGFSSNFDMKNIYTANHKTGSLFIFDTQLLHRGGYDIGTSERIIFHLEFSNPAKHKIANGPIGTNEINSFDFDSILLQITAFADMLDPARLSNDGNSSHYSVIK